MIHEVKQFDSPGAVFIRCRSDEPVLATPFVIKGAIIKSFPNEKFISFINGDMRGTLAYPRIQVKILRGQLCFFAVNEGMFPTIALARQLETLKINGKEIIFTSSDEDNFPDPFCTTPGKYHKYKFITPWVALNEVQIYRYEPMFTDERRNFLNAILEKNLEFILKDLGAESIEPIQVRFRASSLTPKIVPYSKLGSFKGYFTTNIDLPNYLGLGNNITKGLGTVIKWKYRPRPNHLGNIDNESNSGDQDHFE